MGGGYAWVTLATNDSYSLGALVLAHSLKQVGTQQQLAVLITPGVTGPMRTKLGEVFNVIKEVNILDSKDEANLKLLKRPELGITFTKLHCWRLTQFEKCVFLDADTLVLENCDELFEREELSAAPDIGWPDCFNSGVFVYRPSNDTYEKLIQFALEKGSFDGGDQGLLNLYFSDWAHKDISKHLPFIYNMSSTACYSYLPAFKQFGKNAKIIHFLGSSKPWLQYFNTETRKVHPSEGLNHLEQILQLWWNIFCDLIHPKLSTEMGGLAGAFANLTLGQARTPEQEALDDHLRRQGWEVGNIDYLGRDSFSNIWSKICETLSGETEKEASPPKTEEKSIESAIEPIVATPEKVEPVSTLVPSEPTQTCAQAEPLSAPAPAAAAAAATLSPGSPKPAEGVEQPAKISEPTPAEKISPPEPQILESQTAAPITQTPSPTAPTSASAAAESVAPAAAESVAPAAAESVAPAAAESVAPVAAESKAPPTSVPDPTPAVPKQIPAPAAPAPVPTHALPEAVPTPDVPEPVPTPAAPEPVPSPAAPVPAKALVETAQASAESALAPAETAQASAESTPITPPPDASTQAPADANSAPIAPTPTASSTPAPSGPDTTPIPASPAASPSPVAVEPLKKVEVPKDASQPACAKEPKVAPAKIPQTPTTDVPKEVSKAPPAEATPTEAHKTTPLDPTHKVTEPTPPSTPKAVETTTPPTPGSPQPKSLGIDTSVPDTPPPAAATEAAAGPTPPPRKGSGTPKKSGGKKK